MRQRALFLAHAIVIFSSSIALVQSASPPSRCRGTNYGTTIRLHGSTPDQRLARLRDRYGGCVLVDGNVELVGLDQINNLNFLNDIEVITGYLLIYRTQLENVSLPALTLVRGERLFVDRSHPNRTTAAVAVIDNPTLRQLNLSRLVEVSSGNALFENNTRLCYINTIRWDDILEDGNATSIGLTSSGIGCFSCSSCDGGRCWTPGSCQRLLSKVVCPSSCSGRCIKGSSNYECCSAKCAGGCFGPALDSFCTECQRVKDDDGRTCRDSCIAPSLELLGTRLCIAPADCPSNFLQPTIPAPSCSLNCLENTLTNQVYIFDETTGQCKVCDDPPCKKCRGVEQVGPVIHKGNIASFAGCRFVEGSIHIDRVSFTGDALAGIEALTVADLQALADITEINGYLAITDVDDPTFTDLSFLSNLRAIRGRFTPYATNWSLYIENNSPLVSLGMISLERIDRGNVRINENERLCFVDSINWTQILQDPNSVVFPGSNQDSSTCQIQGSVCDVECGGCWGAGPEQCQNCENFTFIEPGTGIRICVPECNLDSDGKTCLACPDVCARLCKGPTNRDCVSDGPPGSECKYRILQGECLLACPAAFYGSANKTCSPCDSSCAIDGAPPSGRPISCNGSKSIQGSGGCDRCQKILDPDASVLQCVEAGFSCPRGRFEGPVSSGVLACRLCQDGCDECTAFGLQFPSECQKCSEFEEDGRCVDSCSVGTHYANGTTCQKCHPQCNVNCSITTVRCGCTGPSDTDCIGCSKSRERVVVTLSVRLPRTTTEAPRTIPTTPQCNGTNCNNKTTVATPSNATIAPPTTRPPAPPPTRARVELIRCIPACPVIKPLLDPQGFCVDVCPPGYYHPAGASPVCERCDLQCDDSASCTGPSASDCEQCRAKTFVELDGNRTCVDECPVRFDVRPVGNYTCERYNGTEPPTNSSRTTTKPEEKKAPTVGIAVGGGIGGVIFIALILILIYVIYARAQRKPKLEALLLELAELPEEYQSGEAKLEIIDIKSLEFGNKLGTGTFGEVFKGFWHPEGKNLKIPVGIKVLDKTMDLKEEKDFLQEVVLLSAINSSDVLRILGLCMSEEDGVMLIAHYCPFGSLLHFMRRQKRYLTSIALITYSWQIAKGMEFLEVKGIIHGNLACRNVLVQKPNQVKITDYGMGKLAENIEQKTLLPWMAPETIRNGTFTSESDVWSYGVTLWEVMTFGGNPYSNKVGEDILAVLQTGERLRQPKTVTVEVYGLMLRCWLFDETARVSFSELVVDLENLKKDPSRYVIVTKVDELDKDDRAERMRRYADTLGAEEQYELDYDPEAEKALYEDPDAEGFLHYEDPDKLKNGDAVTENPYDNEMEQDQAGAEGYENPLKSPEKTTAEFPAVETTPGYELPTTDDEKKKSNAVFDEPGYESVANSQAPSRIGSEQSHKYNVPPTAGAAEHDHLLGNDDMGEEGYQDPTGMQDDMGEEGYQDPTQNMQDDGEDYENPLSPTDDDGYQAVERPEE